MNIHTSQGVSACLIVVQITVPKGDVTFRLVASGYRDKPDKIS